ncbi:MAG: ABC transporter substrate-binding protein [Alphaproteobacteria bacterium]|nr:ABC transporter substrate-binding protein [Alphaproteobacteria bacterium]
MRVFLAVCASLAALAAVPAAAETKIIRAHGIAMHGAPKYGPGFKHFDYANPDAPKGGDVRLSAIGSFDSFNPYVLKGEPAAGIGNLYETLLANSGDEAFSEYGLLAETIEMPEDRSWVAFTLRREARWHDGKPVTPADVIFSLEILKTKGHPFYRSYFKDIARAEQTGERTVKFSFADGVNRELPLIAGQLPVLPKHWWATRDFDKTTLEPPLGSGPYRVRAFEAGRSITYERVPDYWGREIPVRRGMYNAATIRYDYYRDGTVALEAFKAGEYDFRMENVAKDWATAYDAPPVRDGLIKKVEIENERPTGMQAFAFNTRREAFKDPRTRQALSHAFDFEWANKNLFYGQYVRTRSYFSNSELASRGLPQGEELKILEKYRGLVPEEVFTKEYAPPVAGTDEALRANLRVALDLLKAAGWTVKDRKMTDAQGRPFRFEILLAQPTFERVALPFVRNLERLGIEARVRTVEPAQYRKRIDDFDFDMIVESFGQSLSPGNEQRDFWSSSAAGTPGSRNTVGVKDPVVDELVELVIAAPDRESLIARTRALDRVLLSGHYVVPNWHIRVFRVAYWDRFGRPGKAPKYTLCVECWWVDAAKARALDERRGRK